MSGNVTGTLAAPGTAKPGRGVVKSVSTGDPDVERDLGLGRMRCPSCCGTLKRWGWARTRSVRTLSGTAKVRPRRARCALCGRTHVLLPDFLLLRRADAVDVIGAALTAHSRAQGYRRIAKALGRPPTTVRDWLRRWRRRPAGVLPGRVWGWREAARSTSGRLLSPRPRPVPARLPNTSPPRAGPSSG